MTGILDSLIAIALFILVLGGLVLFHELGHFLTARAARIRVLEFGIGFPPKARSLGRGGVGAADVAAYTAAREAALAASRNDEKAHEAVLEAPEGPRGTEYTLNWLPIGGFVKLEDEDGQQGFDPRSFGKAPAPREARDPRRGRRDEPAAGVRDLHRRRVARHAPGRVQDRRGRARRRRR